MGSPQPVPTLNRDIAAIALVGMPGSGKSTVGRQLSRQLGFDFVDSDAIIEQRLGVPIRDWFAQHGEEAFRDVEQAVIEELSQRDGIVLATGGGSVLRPSNRNALHAHCHVFYLRSNPDELFRRLRHDTQRPLLQVRDPLAKLRELYRDRDPLYRRTAHFVVEAARPTVQALTSMVMMQLELADLVPSQPGNASALPDTSVPSADGVSPGS
jgi:shikimate kinase